MFVDRRDAGRQLGDRLRRLPKDDFIVLALPRGGVPVGFEVAVALDACLDVMVVRKLGAPDQPELAMGAIGEDGVCVVDERTVRSCDVSDAALSRIIDRQQGELDRRVELFRGHRPNVSIGGRSAIVVDDGIATGATMRAACRVIRARDVKRITVAVPVAAPSALRRLDDDVDTVISLTAPASFEGVGRFYEHFEQTTEDEVLSLLDESNRRMHIDTTN